VNINALSPLRKAAIGLLSLTLSACTIIGPDFQPPEQPVLPSSWDGTNTEQQAEQVANWWRQFNDPVLTDLIRRGGQQNLSIEAAGLRIVQARAALGFTDALSFPQQQVINGSLAKVYQNETTFTAASSLFEMGWEMDIWGKYARGSEAAEAAMYASIASYRDVLVSISAEIARNYVNYRTAQERIKLALQNVAIQTRVLELTSIQFESGNVSELDVQQSAAQLHATESAVPSLKLSAIQAMNAIAVLLGTLPENIAPLLATEQMSAGISLKDKLAARAHIERNAYRQDYNQYSLIPAAACMPVESIDPQLVMQRPDLQVAELQARAQSARIGLTKADLYPSFFLAGNIGLSQVVPSGDSFSGSSALTAAIGPGISWKVFQYDRIENQVRIEDALFQQSLTNYNLQVLNAVREVSNAALGCDYLTQKSDFDLSGVQASIRAFNISAREYNNGLIGYERLLSSVQTMTIREDAYAQTRGGIANQVIALYKALGGGWQAHSDLPIVKPATVEQMRNRSDWDNDLDDDRVSGDSIGDVDAS
jgi:outer membrane protein TolC